MSFPQDLKGMDGDNNNLHQTVLALEFIYTNKKLFEDGKSLEERGKSRADFWALAGIVAVEYSVNNNNLACKAETDVYVKRLKAHSCGHRYETQYYSVIHVNTVLMENTIYLCILPFPCT